MRAWLPRASAAAAIAAVGALALAVVIGASTSSGPLAVAGYGMGFQPLPRGEQGAVTRDADIAITAAVPVRDLRITFRARGLDIPRSIRISIDGVPGRAVRLPADRSIPIRVTLSGVSAAGGHTVRLSADGPERPQRPFVIVSDLDTQATEAPE